MNYASIRNNDIANGEGVRVSLFVSGCDFHCPGCFNPEAQDHRYGKKLTADVIYELMDMVRKPTISGLSILGGDPLCQDTLGVITMSRICRDVHLIGKTVWLWTGYKWEDVVSTLSRDTYKINLISNCDVVIDGQFDQTLADRKLVWRGSANQRIIDAKESLQTGRIVIYKE